MYYYSKEYVRIENSSGTYDTEYVYMNDQMVAEVNLVDSSKKYHHTDHLNSVSAITNSSGDVTEQTLYSPYGEVLQSGSSRYGYESKEHDNLVGDTDFHFRKYKPEW